jgi:hypothetical protein
MNLSSSITLLESPLLESRRESLRLYVSALELLELEELCGM